MFTRRLNCCGKTALNKNSITNIIRLLSKDATVNKETPVDKQLRATAIQCPDKADVVIIGGGAMGSSTAYWLKEKSKDPNFKVVVVEKDPTYAICSTTLSVGGVRQQFSVPENVQMSLYGAEFIETLKSRFGPEADVSFFPRGYLLLASEEGAETMKNCWKLQKELGAVSVLLNKEELRRRYPWMNVSDVELGCLGLEKEGWFDPWLLLSLLKSGSKGLGAQFIKGEIVDFQFNGKCGIEKEKSVLSSVVVKLPNGEQKPIECKYCVLAAGVHSGEVAKLAKIGCGPGVLEIPLPVEKRKRFVFKFNCREDTTEETAPMLIDYTGTYFRRDGQRGSFLCGKAPSSQDEPSVDDMEVDYAWFEEQVWPNLAHRVPAFGGTKVVSAWCGFYEFNTFDENGIIGHHPYYENLLFAAGFSGHGIQQSPAVGRSIAELILDGAYQTLDLSRLGFNRLIENKPMYESGIF